MKKLIIALILTIGMLGATTASADTTVSIGWIFTGHGDVVTHIGVSETFRRHHHRRHHHHHRPYNPHTKTWHHGHRHGRRHHKRHHDHHTHRRHHHRNHHRCDHH